MKNKAVKTILNVVASLVVFVVMLVVTSEVFGWILGTTKDANGAEKIKGGGVVTVIAFGLGAVVAIAFGVWFSKFLNRKSTAVKE